MWEEASKGTWHCRCLRPLVSGSVHFWRDFMKHHNGIKGGLAYPNNPLWSVYMDDPVVRQLLPGFAVVLQKRVALICEALRRGDFTETGRLAHIIRGSSGSYGYGCIADVAGRLEIQASSSRDMVAMARDIAELRGLAEGVLLAVSSLPERGVS